MKSLKYMAAAAVAAVLAASCTLDLPRTQILPEGDMTAPVLNVTSDTNTTKC